VASNGHTILPKFRVNRFISSEVEKGRRVIAYGQMARCSHKPTFFPYKRIVDKRERKYMVEKVHIWTVEIEDT
jgi:hypothetical protein